MNILKNQFKEKYFKVFTLHYSELFKTVKLAYHLIPKEREQDVNNGQYYFVKNEEYPNTYKKYDLIQQDNDNHFLSRFR